MPRRKLARKLQRVNVDLPEYVRGQLSQTADRYGVSEAEQVRKFIALCLAVEEGMDENTTEVTLVTKEGSVRVLLF